MSGYAQNFTAQLLRAAVAGRTGYKEGQAAGGAAVAKSAADAREERRKELLAQAQAAIAERTAGLQDPNDPAVLAAKEAASVNTHAKNRLFDVAHPTRDMSGSTPGGTDKVAQRARQAYKARLMTPTPQRFGPPRPGMTESEAEELATSAYGPSDGSGQGPDTSTRSLMGGSILRGGGAAAVGKGGSSTSTASKSVKSSSAPANDPKLNVSGGKKTGNIDLTAAPPAASAIPTGANLKERDMERADLWDKKVREGMTPVQATAYVNRLKGGG